MCLLRDFDLPLISPRRGFGALTDLQGGPRNSWPNFVIGKFETELEVNVSVCVTAGAEFAGFKLVLAPVSFGISVNPGIELQNHARALLWSLRGAVTMVTPRRQFQCLRINIKKCWCSTRYFLIRTWMSATILRHSLKLNLWRRVCVFQHWDIASTSKASKKAASGIQILTY